MFVVWKALYLFWLRPIEFPDRPLTKALASCTSGLLNLGAGPRLYRTRDVLDSVWVDDVVIARPAVDIYRGGDATLRVANECNGLELTVLYIGFLICMPGLRGSSTGRKWKYAVAGSAIIFLLNILRCALLVLIFVYERAYLDFSHHFLFTFIIYAVTFLLWYRYAKKSFSYAV